MKKMGQNPKFGIENPFLGNLGTRFEFWSHIIFSVGKLHSNSCPVYIFLAHNTAALMLFGIKGLGLECCWHHCRPTGWAKKLAQFFYTLITLSNRNQFLKFFYCRNQKKICSNTVTKDLITPHMSLHYLVKYQTSHLSRRRHWRIAWSTLIEPIYSDLIRLNMLCGGPFNKWSINIENSRQSTSWSRRSSLSGANLQRLDDRAIVQWRRRLECIIHKADTLNNFDEKTARCDSCFRQ